MFELKKSVNILTACGQIKFNTMNAPSTDEILKINTEYSVDYQLDETSAPEDIDIEYILESFNNTAANQIVAAFLEYYNPGMYVTDLFAFLSLGEDSKMHAVVSVKFKVMEYDSEEGMVVHMLGRDYILGHGLMTITNSFQPLYDGDCSNMASTFYRVGKDDAIESSFSGNRISFEAVLSIMDPDKVFKAKLSSRDDLLVNSKTYIDESGIAMHYVDVSSVYKMYRKYTGRKMHHSEADPIILSFITDVVNNIQKPLQVFSSSLVSPMIHIASTDNSVGVVIDYTKGFNMAITKFSDKPNERSFVTSCKLDIIGKQYDRSSGETSIEFEFTQNNNTREFIISELANIAMECLNFRGICYSPSMEEWIFAKCDGKYIGYDGISNPSNLFAVGTPVYSIYDRSSYLYAERNKASCKVPIAGTIYTISKTCAKNITTSKIARNDSEDDSGIKYRFTLSCKAILLSNSKATTAWKKSFAPKNSVYEIQYIMDQLYVFSNGRNQIMIMVIDSPEKKDVPHILKFANMLSTKIKLKPVKQKPSCVTSDLVVFADKGSDA